MQIFMMSSPLPRHPAAVNNWVALILGLIVIAVFVADAAYFGLDLPVLVMEQIARLSQWMTFWR